MKSVNSLHAVYFFMFCCRLVTFLKISFFETKYFRNTIRVPKGLDTDKNRVQTFCRSAEVAASKKQVKLIIGRSNVTAQLAITSQLGILGCSQFRRPTLKSEIPISCLPVECIKQLFNVQELFYI